MKIATLVLTALTGHAAFAWHLPIPKDQLPNANDLVEKTRMEADYCVSDKLECEKWRERKGASSYVTVPDDSSCEAVSDQDTETVGCYLKD